MPVIYANNWKTASSACILYAAPKMGREGKFNGFDTIAVC